MTGFATTAALVVLLALGSALHCVGMCGGFSLLIATGGTRAAPRLALFHGGRALTYAFLGAFAGSGGAMLARSAASARGVALVAGGLMLAAAVLPWLLRRDASGGAPALLAPLRRFASAAAAPLRALASRSGVAGPLLLGAANGFLPCGATATALLLATASGSGAAGAAAMLLFGVATAPALFGLALWGRRLPVALRTRLAGARVALTLVVGLLTLWRGIALVPPCCGGP